MSELIKEARRWVDGLPTPTRTIDLVGGLADALEAAEAKLAAVEAKHRMMTDDDEPYCLTCFQSPYGHAPWPCPTVAALGLPVGGDDANPR